MANCVDTYKDSGFKWIGKIPVNWNVQKLKYCFYQKKTKANQTNPTVLSLARDGIKVRDISTNEGQLAADYSDYNPVEPNDLLLNPMDLYSGDNCNISKISGVISPAYVNLRVLNGNIPEFYNYYFKVQYWTMAFFVHGKGVSYENRWTLTNETLKNYPVVLPNPKQQKAIADYLDKKCGEIDEVVETEKAVIEKLKEYKQSIITEAVTKGLDKSVPLKDSGIEYLGNIPSRWNIKRLRYIATCQNGISKGGEFFGKGSPFITYKDVYNNNVLPKNVSGLCMVDDLEKEHYSVQENDIFFTRTSETIEEIALTCVCKKTIPDATFAGFLIRVRPYTNELLVDFSKYYFASEIHRKFFVKEMNLVIRASLSQELLKKLPVLIPPKEEQQQIAEYLDKKCGEIDTAIANKEKLIEKFTEYKKSLIYECVTGKKEVALCV